MRIALVALAHVCVLAAAACTGASASTESPDDAASEGAAGEGEGEGEGEGAGAGAGAIGEGESVGKELPTELVAELRMQGAGTDGRLLTLAPGFMATAACSDCGAPTYLWFLAVRCVDPRHCAVLTEQCEGQIRRDASTYVLEFSAVEDSAGAEICAGYSGTFESQ